MIVTKENLDNTARCTTTMIMPAEVEKERKEAWRPGT
jgi:hypothetical protein